MKIQYQAVIYIFKNQLVKLLLITSLITNRHWFEPRIWFYGQIRLSLPMDNCHFGYMIKKFITKTPIQRPNPPKTTLPCILLFKCVEVATYCMDTILSSFPHFLLRISSFLYILYIPYQVYVLDISAIPMVGT